MLKESENEKGLATVLTDSVRDRLFRQRAIIINGDINQTLAGQVTIQLLALAAENDDPVTVFINSQGGHVESGDTIHDMIRFVRPRVRMVGTGWVASAGALIYVAVPTADRYCLPNTRFLLHEPSAGFQGATPDMDIEVRQLLLMRQRLNAIMARQTGQPLERIEADTKRNFWLDAGAAKEYGIVGRIVEKSEELK
jgi:ATP-dependent Clp protease, protease subunit